MSNTAPPTPLDLAQHEWKKIFDGGPYTGMLMLQYIIQATGKSIGDFLLDPKNSIKTITDSHISHFNFQQLAATWNVDAGRCTSFAVKAITELKSHKDATGAPIFNFEIYDLTRHRVARCRKTGVVIDSSSSIRNGAFVLAEGAWGRFPETNASWKFKSDESKFEREGKEHGQIKKSSSPISPTKAMVICLKEVEESAYKSVPTLFRSVNAQNKPEFHGIIVWCPRDHAIELGASISDLRDGRKLVIQFPKYITVKGKTGLDPKMAGTAESLEQCLEYLVEFIRQYGGPHGMNQWESTGVDEFNTALIQAAVELWGFPKPTEKALEWAPLIISLEKDAPPNPYCRLPKVLFPICLIYGSLLTVVHRKLPAPDAEQLVIIIADGLSRIGREPVPARADNISEIEKKTDEQRPYAVGGATVG
ncbi:hypothetical protein B0T26DRAFT_681840 [Lasiosphaeria miniovina]|uniref:Uncharacterized protein n=1 Tax=Lasiosphaeria miniovina TaxID=1954250 RepID=A0AA40DI69_9PEZI|nr:uncharacterized protein B0T26DRAFT_681840 [Lasiosphaeria miniovina]KAK0701722.1 hypothetical protein B0T26DRAFT_681840 [Lasiosphaeria miniovina]